MRSKIINIIIAMIYGNCILNFSWATIWQCVCVCAVCACVCVCVRVFYL